jgi:hypothetical protein
MKLNREQIKELFGSVATVPGKTQVGFEYRVPVKGDIYLREGHTWGIITSGDGFKSMPVAIFEATHREDGTPMEIAKLPESTEYRYEYYGHGLEEEYCNYIFYRGGRWSDIRRKNPNGHVSGNSMVHYALAYKIAKPTRLEDLVGDGQKISWYLEKGTGRIERLNPFLDTYGKLHCFKGMSVKGMADRGHRWSHNPATPFTDANEFVA